MDRSASLPGSWSAWSGQVWSGILFPGPTTATSSAVHLRAVLLLIFLPGLLLYPCLRFHLFEPDEGRYAQIPREMLQRGDWIVPTLQGEPYLDKPPLFYWLVMMSYQVFGYHDWAARLIPALAVHATLLLIYLFGRRIVGERAALAGALILTLAPGFLAMSRLLLLDGVLAFMVTLAVFAGFEAIREERLRWSWWTLSAFACGLGILTKGPIAFVLLAPPLLLYSRLSGRGCRPGLAAWGLFLGIAIAVALPWFVALSLQLPQFIGYFFWEHNLQRFLAPAVHVRGVWFYGPVLLGLLFPTTLLLWPIGKFFLSLDERTAQKRGPELGFLVLAGSWCVLFFTLSSCKLPTYLLPGMPFLALALGVCALHLHHPRLIRALAMTSFGVLLLLNYVALPWYAWYRSPMSRPAEVLAVCADRDMPVVCYPRTCDSLAFYIGRDDLRAYRSKEIEDLRTLVRIQPRTVILCTHRHSLKGLKELLPPEVRIVHEVRMGLGDIPGVPPSLMKPLAKLMGETALGLSDLAVVEMPPLCQARGLPEFGSR